MASSSSSSFHSLESPHASASWCDLFTKVGKYSDKLLSSVEVADHSLYSKFHAAYYELKPLLALDSSELAAQMLAELISKHIAIKRVVAGPFSPCKWMDKKTPIEVQVNECKRVFAQFKQAHEKVCSASQRKFNRPYPAYVQLHASVKFKLTTLKNTLDASDPRQAALEKMLANIQTLHKRVPKPVFTQKKSSSPSQSASRTAVDDLRSLGQRVVNTLYGSPFATELTDLILYTAVCAWGIYTNPPGSNPY